MSKPLDSQWVLVKHKLQYLKGTLFQGLHFQHVSIAQPLSLIAFCDPDWVSNIVCESKDTKEFRCKSCL